MKDGENDGWQDIRWNKWHEQTLGRKVRIQGKRRLGGRTEESERVGEMVERWEGKRLKEGGRGHKEEREREERGRM